MEAQSGAGARRLFVVMGWAALAALPAACIGPGPAPATAPPTLRPTHAFPTAGAIAITSAEGRVLEQEPGPLYVLLSTVDEHGLPGEPDIAVLAAPEAAGSEIVARVPPRTYAQVLEIRRLPPDYLRTFYRVQALPPAEAAIEGWVSDWYVRRTAYVVAFDAAGCACPFRLELWRDPGLTQAAGTVANRAPLRLLAPGESAVQVLVLADGQIGWLPRGLIYESQEKEFLRAIAPVR